jgi:hypothetical protein
MNENSPYRGTIPLILPSSCAFKAGISTFLYVGSTQISCGLLPTRFSSIFLLIYCKKREISGSFIEKFIRKH